MRLRPQPSKMFFLKGPRARIVHLGYVEYQKERSLCGAKLGKYQRPVSELSISKSNCKGCLKRLKAIQRMIGQWGIVTGKQIGRAHV